MWVKLGSLPHNKDKHLLSQLCLHSQRRARKGDFCNWLRGFHSACWVNNWDKSQCDLNKTIKSKRGKNREVKFGPEIRFLKAQAARRQRPPCFFICDSRRTKRK